MSLKLNIKAALSALDNFIPGNSTGCEIMTTPSGCSSYNINKGPCSGASDHPLLTMPLLVARRSKPLGAAQPEGRLRTPLTTASVPPAVEARPTRNKSITINASASPSKSKDIRDGTLDQYTRSFSECSCCNARPGILERRARSTSSGRSGSQNAQSTPLTKVETYTGNTSLRVNPANSHTKGNDSLVVASPPPAPLGTQDTVNLEEAARRLHGRTSMGIASHPNVNLFNSLKGAATHPSGTGRQLLVLGLPLARRLVSASGTGAKAVLMALDTLLPGVLLQGGGSHEPFNQNAVVQVSNDPTGCSIGPSSVWCTNKLREKQATAVIELDLETLRVGRDIIPPERAFFNVAQREIIVSEEAANDFSASEGSYLPVTVKREHYRDLYVHLVSDQPLFQHQSGNASIASHIIVSSSHHPASGFVTVARQVPGLNPQISAAGGDAQGGGLYATALLVRGCIVAPYLKITVAPIQSNDKSPSPAGGIGMAGLQGPSSPSRKLANIRIVYINIFAANGSTSRKDTIIQCHSNAVSHLPYEFYYNGFVSYHYSNNTNADADRGSEKTNLSGVDDDDSASQEPEGGHIQSADVASGAFQMRDARSNDRDSSDCGGDVEGLEDSAEGNTIPPPPSLPALDMSGATHLPGDHHEWEKTKPGPNKSIPPLHPVPCAKQRRGPKEEGVDNQGDNRDSRLDGVPLPHRPPPPTPLKGVDSLKRSLTTDSSSFQGATESFYSGGSTSPTESRRGLSLEGPLAAPGMRQGRSTELLFRNGSTESISVKFNDKCDMIHDTIDVSGEPEPDARPPIPSPEMDLLGSEVTRGSAKLVVANRISKSSSYDISHAMDSDSSGPLEGDDAEPDKTPGEASELMQSRDCPAANDLINMVDKTPPSSRRGTSGKGTPVRGRGSKMENAFSGATGIEEDIIISPATPTPGTDGRLNGRRRVRTADSNSAGPLSERIDPPAGAHHQERQRAKRVSELLFKQGTTSDPGIAANTTPVTTPSPSASPSELTGIDIAGLLARMRQSGRHRVSGPVPPSPTTQTDAVRSSTETITVSLSPAKGGADEAVADSRWTSTQSCTANNNTSAPSNDGRDAAGCDDEGVIQKDAAVQDAGQVVVLQQQLLAMRQEINRLNRIIQEHRTPDSSSSRLIAAVTSNQAQATERPGIELTVMTAAKRAWDDTRTLLSTTELLLRWGESAAQSTTIPLHVPLAVAVQPQHSGLTNLLLDALIDPRQACDSVGFVSEFLHSLLTFPSHQHFIGIGDIARIIRSRLGHGIGSHGSVRCGAHAIDLSNNYDLFLLLLAFLYQAASATANVSISTVARCRQGFIVTLMDNSSPGRDSFGFARHHAAKRSTVVVLALSPEDLLKALSTYNKTITMRITSHSQQHSFYRQYEAMDYINKSIINIHAGNDNKGEFQGDDAGSSGGGSPKVAPAPLPQLSIRYWVDFPASCFMLLLEDIIEMSGLDESKGNKLVYLTRLTDNEDEGDGHPLLAFFEVAPAQGTPSDPPTALHLPLTCWRGLLLRGRAVRDGGGYIASIHMRRHDPAIWVHRFNDGPPPTVGLDKLCLYTGHVVDVALRCVDPAGTGLLLSGAQLASLRLLLDAGTGELAFDAMPVDSHVYARTRRLIEAASIIRDDSASGVPGSAADLLLEALLVSLRRKWSTIILWLDNGEERTDDVLTTFFSPMFDILNKWYYAYPTKIIICTVDQRINGGVQSSRADEGSLPSAQIPLLSALGFEICPSDVCSG